MKNLLRNLSVVVAAIAVWVCLPTYTPAIAIANPNSTSIGDVFFFEDVLSSGDALIFVRYDVSYATQPDEDSEDTFLVALYDTDGTTLLFTRPLNYYQHNIISLYIEPEENTLTTGSAYYVRVMGDPAIFDLIENINMDTQVLSGSSYYSASDLGGVMIGQAEILEADWAVTLLTSGDKLNTTGATYFLKAVPGLSAMAPEIFSTAYSTITYGRFNYTEEGLNITKTQMPVSLNSALNGLTQMVGGPNAKLKQGQFGMWFVIWLIIAAAVFAKTENTFAAVGTMVMGAAFGGYLGVAQEQMYLFYIAIGTIVIFWFGITIVAPKFG